MSTLKRTNNQAGFTLIEVLVSALVLVVGVLGVAALQVTALKNLQSSGNTGVASMLANDIADRMWVNDDQAKLGSYVHSKAPNGEVLDCVENKCTADQVAAYDIQDWQQQLEGYTTTDGVSVPPMLPSGQGEVTSLGGTTYQIRIRWDDDRSGSTKTNCPPQSEADLDCYTITVTLRP